MNGTKANGNGATSLTITLRSAITDKQVITQCNDEIPIKFEASQQEEQLSNL